MNQQFLHEISIAELRDALAKHFPEQGSIVYLNIKYDCQLYGSPIWSANLKFGRSGKDSGSLIEIDYAEKFDDLCASIHSKLEEQI